MNQLPTAATAPPSPTDQRSHNATNGHALAAISGKPVTRVVIEQAQLDKGIPVMFRRFDSGTVRLAYDPDQTTYAGAQAMVAVEFGVETLDAIRLRLPFVFETAELDADTPLVLRKTDKHVHIGWDPRHITYAQAIDLFWLCAESAGVDATGVDLPTVRQMADAAEMTRIVAESADPAATAARVLDLIKAEKNQPVTGHAVTTCGVLAWCVRTDDHEWHESAPIQVAQECSYRSSGHDHAANPYIDVKLIAEDDRETGVRGAGATVSLGDCELTADGLRSEAAKILAAAPRLRAMADTLDGAPAYVPPTTWEDAAEVRTVGAKGPVFSAYLHTPTEHETGTADNPTSLVVFPGATMDAELDLDGGRDLREQLVTFLPQLDAMIAVLAETSAR